MAQLLHDKDLYKPAEPDYVHFRQVSTPLKTMPCEEGPPHLQHATQTHTNSERNAMYMNGIALDAQTGWCSLWVRKVLQI